MFNSSVSHVISRENLRRNVPAVFADAPAGTLSDHYKFIPTIEVVDAIADLGFLPVWARQTKARIGNKETTKHLLRFRHEDHVNVDRYANKNDQYPEIVMVNAHNGTSTYRIMAGIFRTVCENGMIVQDENLGNVRIRHASKEVDFFKEVREISCRVVENAHLGLKQLEEWKQIPLSRPEKLAYAAGVNNYLDTTYTPESLIRINRYEDRDDTLYSAFQTVQENVIKGNASKRNEKGQVRKSSAVKAVDKDVKLNQALWAFTAALAAQKV